MGRVDVWKKVVWRGKNKQRDISGRLSIAFVIRNITHPIV